MNKGTAKEYLPLVQALADGRVIEHKGRAGWYTADEPSFDFPPDQYRIKPEPKEVWFNRYEHGVTHGPYGSKEEAENNAANFATQVRYREVIE